MTKERCIITSKSYPWEKYNNQEEYEEIVKDIYEAMIDRRLVFFIGAGIPRIQGYVNWNGYIDKLLNYWKGKISKDKKDIIQYNMYINSIDKIKESDIDKRRKVDFLNQILEDVYGENYKNIRLDFEKEYFQNFDMGKYNPVLESLSELDAMYFTTNYDNQIEKHLEYMRSVGTEVQDMNELNKYIDDDNDNISLFTVVHLHGIPNGKFENFISSSTSYKNHYYINDNRLDNIRKWIENKKLLVVFLGSSMEEEEILSLLPDTQKDFKHIAFMTAGNVYSDVDYYMLKMKKRFFKQKNNTRIFWYGANHNDLPEFIEKLKQDIDEKQEAPSNQSNFYEFRKHATSEPRIAEIFKNTAIGVLEQYISGLSEGLYESRTQAFFKSKLLNNGNKNIPYGIWNILLNQLNNDKLSKEQLGTIIKYQLKNDNAFRYIGGEKFLQNYVELKDLSKKEEEYYKEFASKKNAEITTFMKIPTIAGWKLVDTIISSNNQQVYLPEYISKYNLTKNAETKLLEFLKTHENDVTFLTFSPGSFGEFNKIADILSKIISKHELTVDNKKWEINLSDEFYKSSFFIKILMLVYHNNEEQLPEIVVQKILDNVDYSDYGLGEYFGQFLKKYATDINIDPEKYSNHFKGGFVKQESIFSIDDVKNLDNDTILDTLQSFDYLKENGQNSLLKEKTIDGTVTLFKNVLISNNQNYNKIKKKLLGFLFNKFDQLHSDYSLFNYFRSLYLTILKDKLMNTKNIEELSLKILKGYENKCKGFDFIDHDFFAILLKDKDIATQVIDVFLQLDVNKFPIYNPLDKENLDFNSFLALDVVSYFRIVDRILIMDDRYKSKIIDKINILNNNDIKQLMDGKYYDLYNKHEFIDEYNLWGFLLNRYSGDEFRLDNDFLEDNIGKFVNVAKKMLRKGYAKSNLKNYIDFIALKYINPNDMKKINWEKIDYIGIIDTILDSRQVIKYEREWFKQLMKNLNNDCIKYLLNIFGDERVNTDKIVKYIYSIDKFINESSYKLDIYNWNFKIDDNKNKLKNSYFDLVRKLLINRRLNNITKEMLDKLVKHYADDKEKSQGILDIIRRDYGEEIYSKLFEKYIKI